MSIGVNDIWKYHKCEVVVCLDERRNFTKERMQVIDDCRPQIFYSQLDCYRGRTDFNRIEILPSYPDVTCDLSLSKFQKSFCSPFVAVQIAYRYYDTNDIHLFGIDMVNHPHLNTKLCERIKTHFTNLKRSLDAMGCSLIVHGDGILKNLL